MSMVLHLSCSAMIAFLAVSNRSASSFSISALNSGTPPFEASNEPGLAVWNGTGLRFVLGRGVGGWAVRMFRND